MHLRRISTAVLSLGLAAAALAAQPATASAAPGDRGFEGLEGPVLSTDDRGNHLLVARRAVKGTAQGALVTSSLKAGSRRWSKVARLSSQNRTVGLDVDSDGAGRSSVAWTAGGHVYTRARNLRGTWDQQTKLSRRSGTRWVTTDVNRAGDQAVAWLQGGRVALAWRPANGSWRRWVGPASTLRPALALGERKAGRADVRITWLQGKNSRTSVRMRTWSVRANVTQRRQRVLFRSPGITEFGWGAGPNRMVLGIIRGTQPGEPLECEGSPCDVFAVHDGSLTTGPLVLRHQRQGVNVSGVTVAVSGSASRVAVSEDRIAPFDADDWPSQVSSISAIGGTWAPWRWALVSGPGATLAIEDRGRGLIGSIGPSSDGGTSLGVMRLEHDRRAVQLVGSHQHPVTPLWSGPFALGVGNVGRFAAAWTRHSKTGTSVQVRTFARQ